MVVVYSGHVSILVRKLKKKKITICFRVSTGGLQSTAIDRPHGRLLSTVGGPVHRCPKDCQSRCCLKTGSPRAIQSSPEAGGPDGSATHQLELWPDMSDLGGSKP
jgi:hypothetical protein